MYRAIEKVAARVRRDDDPARLDRLGDVVLGDSVLSASRWSNGKSNEEGGVR
jgi:hypothetical protein